MRSRTAEPVVDANVVEDRPAGRAALEVYPRCDVLVDRVGDDPLAGAGVVVDAVVAVVVGDVVVDQRVVRARERFDPGVLVVVGDVAVDGVSRRCVEPDPGGLTLPSLRVAEREVAADLVGGRSARQLDAGIAVVIGVVPRDQRIRGVV